MGGRDPLCIYLYNRASFQGERVFYTLILGLHGQYKTGSRYCTLKQWLTPHPHTTENESLQDA